MKVKRIIWRKSKSGRKVGTIKKISKSATGIKQPKLKAGKFAYLELSKIVSDPKHPRNTDLSQVRYQRITKSIERGEVIAPVQVIEVKPGKFPLKDVHVRFAACLNF